MNEQRVITYLLQPKHFVSLEINPFSTVIWLHTDHFLYALLSHLPWKWLSQV